GSDRSGLHATDHSAKRRKPRTETVDSTVDEPDIDTFPKTPFSNGANRSNDRPVVNLVNVVLVDQKPSNETQSLAAKIGGPRLLEEEEDGQPDTSERDDRRHGHQPQLQSGSLLDCRHCPGLLCAGGPWSDDARRLTGPSGSERDVGDKTWLEKRIQP